VRISSGQGARGTFRCLDADDVLIAREGLLGEQFAGLVSSDRFTAYNSLPTKRRQWCCILPP
jgi:hypothetical protein